MKQPRFLFQAFVAGAFCLAIQGQAQVYYTIANTSGAATGSGYSDLENVNLKIDTTTANNALAGGIQITEHGGPVAGLPTSYTTICTDIEGTLYLGQTYEYNTPSSSFNGPPVLSGVKPIWGADNAPGNTFNQANATQAIQNAAYLFYTYGNLTSAGITATGNADAQATQMAALQLAVWEALYDTTDSGKVVLGSTARFQALSGGDQTVVTDAGNLITALNNLSGVGNFGYTGNLLFPTAGGNVNSDGEPPQELLIAAVPEPTTMIAGALLLLPFGVSTLRILRRRNNAQ